MKSESKITTIRVEVATVDDVEEGNGIVVEAAGRKLALFRVQGKLRCIADRCPHAGGSLGRGTVCDGEVHCPRHGWRFELETGRCRSDPRFQVDCFAVEVDDGIIYVEVPTPT